MEAGESEGTAERNEATRFYRAGVLLARAGRHDVAAASYAKHLEACPCDAKALHNRGVSLAALGKTDAALSCFERAFAENPSNTDAAVNAAGCLIQQGEGAKAAALSRTALEVTPALAQAWYNLNTALRMDGRLVEAVDLSWSCIRKARGCESDEPMSPKATRVRLSEDVAAAERVVLTPAAETGAGPGSAMDAARDSVGATEPRRPSGGGDGDGAAVTVVCVKWGSKYASTYVNRLARGLKRYLTLRHRLICFTDSETDIDPGVEVRALPVDTPWKGWWHKAWLFSPEAKLSGRIFYIDLDSVIVGPMDPIAGYAGAPFATLSVRGMANEKREQGYNSSVMLWDADGSLSSIHGLLSGLWTEVTGCMYKFDHWLEMCVDQAALLQDVLPAGLIVEFKSLGEGSPGPPEGASLVCFPLRPKPHECSEDWVRQAWGWAHIGE